jgi:hypothetical protein
MLESSFSSKIPAFWAHSLPDSDQNFQVFYLGLIVAQPKKAKTQKMLSDKFN